MKFKEQSLPEGSLLLFHSGIAFYANPYSSEFAQSKQDLITLSPLIHLSFCIIQNEKPTINFKLLAFTLLCEIGFLIYDLPLFVPCRTLCEHRKKE